MLIERWTVDGTLPRVVAAVEKIDRVFPQGERLDLLADLVIVARGPGLSAGSRLSSDPDILDLAPTVVELLGLVPAS